MITACDHCIDKTACLTCNPPKAPLVKEADPELERLLAEEEEIERRGELEREIKRLEDLVDELQARSRERVDELDRAFDASHEAGRIQGRQEAFTFVNRLCDLFTTSEVAPEAALAAIKAAAHRQVW